MRLPIPQQAIDKAKKELERVFRAHASRSMDDFIQPFTEPREVELGAYHPQRKLLIFAFTETVRFITEAPSIDESPFSDRDYNGVAVVDCSGKCKVVLFETGAKTPAQMVRDSRKYEAREFVPVGRKTLHKDRSGEHFAGSHLDTMTLTVRERDEALAGR